MSTERSVTVYREGRSTIIPGTRLQEFLDYGYTLGPEVAPPAPPPATDPDVDTIEMARNDLRRVSKSDLLRVLGTMGIDPPDGANKRDLLELIEGGLA